MSVQGHDDIELVEAARTGDPVAFGRLFDRWFDRTYDVSWHIVRNRDTAAEIAQDSFLAAWEQLPTLRQPESFGGWVLRIARNRSLNRLERERHSAPSDDTVMAVLDGRAGHGDIAADVADHERDQLVWAAAAALGERDASLLDLHLRHDLGAAAIAEELDTTPNNVHQLLHRLRGRLAGAIRSWVLWRDGRAQCLGLGDAIDAAGLTHFGADAVRVISAHAADCEVCREAQRAVLAPEALFAAVPVVAAPVALKAQAAAGLMAAGVPVGSALSRAAASGVGDALGGAAGERTIITGGNRAGGTAGDGASSPTGAALAGRSLRSRVASPNRRSLLAAAAVVVLLALATGGVVLAARPASDDRDQAAVTEAEATANDGGPGDGPAEVFGADDPGDPSGSGEPGEPLPPPGASTSTTDLGGSGGGDDPMDPGLPGGPGEPGGPGGPVVPPGGSTTTTEPGGSTGSTTTSTTPPDPDADPPEITSFVARVLGQCPGQGLLREVVLTWRSKDADSASLGLLDALAQPVAPNSAKTECVLLGKIYLLTVSGPGGQDHARVTIAL
ncbi:MAG TPA: sigma-70 family RNA polymerase sigma factor [Acidimicrobiales bacterium]|nr:sigma-70 family RNA polymerase sigma factor [Acidimicrobiales bacterium]